jgi:hypothetical protein
LINEQVNWQPPKTLRSLREVKQAVSEVTYIQYEIDHAGTMTLEVIPPELRDRVLTSLIPDGDYVVERS